MSPTLTIAIPTYNRSVRVEERLAEIVPQLVDGVFVHVFDNCSTDGTAEAVARYRHPSIRYSCARQNMGMCRNICRGLEEAETDWVWILGDDDPITPTAIRDALGWIGATSACVIQFDSTGGRIERPDLIRTIEELYERYDPIRTLFISSLLFKVPPLRKLYVLLSAAIITFGPHTALIIRMLEQGVGSFELRAETLLKPGPVGQRWSTLEVAAGVSMLPEFVLDPKMQRLAARRLRMDVCWMIVYGLREVRDRASVLRFRRIVRQTLSRLRGYGARRFALSTPNRKPSASERKNFALSILIPLLPIPVLLKLASRMRARHLRESGDPLAEFK